VLLLPGGFPLLGCSRCWAGFPLLGRAGLPPAPGPRYPLVPGCTPGARGAWAAAAQEAVGRLEAEHPAWQIWTVHKAIGGIVWCARRRDGEGRPINEDSPVALAAAIRQAGQ
jgi:hypothetical protein